MDYTDRVNEFQIRDVTYIGLPPKNSRPKFDIVKWVQTEPTKVIDGFTGKVIEITEYCYSVGTLEWSWKECCFEFHSVGLRWLEARPGHEVIDMVLKFCEEKSKELEMEE